MREILYQKDDIEVLNSDGILGLYVNDECQGRMRKDGTPVSPYMLEIVKILEALKPKKILFIGGGACILPTYVHNVDTIVDVCEPNQKMLQVAVDHFNYKINGKLYVENGLVTLTRPEKYDAIVLDASHGFTTVPIFFRLKELLLANDKLNVPGIFLANVIPSEHVIPKRIMIYLSQIYGEKNVFCENFKDKQYLFFAKKT